MNGATLAQVPVGTLRCVALKNGATISLDFHSTASWDDGILVIIDSRYELPWTGEYPSDHVGRWLIPLENIAAVMT